MENQQDGRIIMGMNEAQMAAYQARVQRAVDECDRQLKEVEQLKARARKIINRRSHE